MQESLNTILEIQEKDMQMIQLMRLKNERQKELDNINSIKKDLQNKSMIKEGEIIEHKKNIRLIEGEVKEIVDLLKKLEKQQNQVKKVDEFNALSKEMSQAERERVQKEQRLSDLFDKLAAEEEMLTTLKEKLESTIESSKILEQEIHDSITRINAEGKVLLEERVKLVETADQDIFRIYDRLLRNKKDRVVVPIENRCCSGCHILLTAQDENMVRRGERLIFCEHCSRILYWQESEAIEPSVAPKKRRRRRTTA